MTRDSLSNARTQPLDAAHSFAHVVFTVPELDGDYLGASLHKWLCTPLGAGLLHVKKDKISTVWPLLGDTSVPADDIRKLERLGTQPVWTMMAIADALRFHTLVGGERKEARLRYLQQYWTKQLRDHPLGREAAQIGRCSDRHAGSVILETGYGRRMLAEPDGEPLPRIC